MPRGDSQLAVVCKMTFFLKCMSVMEKRGERERERERERGKSYCMQSEPMHAGIDSMFIAFNRMCIFLYYMLTCVYIYIYIYTHACRYITLVYVYI